MAVETWLGVGIAHGYLDPGKPWPTAVPTADAAAEGLPRKVSCHTSLHFVEPALAKSAAGTNAVGTNTVVKMNYKTRSTTPPGGKQEEPYPWRTVYERDGKAVMVERSIGDGTIVLSALSYFVSNEAMRDERHPELLLWVVGDEKRVVFDELHHGIMEQHGIATLARKYRLHWLGAGLLVLAGLFVWKNGVSLVPADSGTHVTLGGPVAEGKGSASGLVNLLRRNIAGETVLRTCVDEYEKSAGRCDGKMREKLERVAAILEGEQKQSARRRDNTRTYNEICRILNEK